MQDFKKEIDALRNEFQKETKSLQNKVLTQEKLIKDLTLQVIELR